MHIVGHDAKQSAAPWLAPSHWGRKLRLDRLRWLALAAHRFDRVLDRAVVVWLLLAAWALTRQYLHRDLFIWGDHPGQFMRFQHALAGTAQSANWLWGVLSWHSTWYAGYPELQFYPPGASLLGVFLHYLTLGLRTPEQTYNLLVALAFCLPLFTCYAVMRITLAPLGRLPSALAGFTASFLAVSLKPMWGGADAVVIGLLGERLAFGLRRWFSWRGGGLWKGRASSG